MLTDQRYKEIQELFLREIEGGVCKDFMQIVDEFIDDDLITQDEFRINEMEICRLFDDQWFTCDGCGWTLPEEEREDGSFCRDCESE